VCSLQCLFWWWLCTQGRRVPTGFSAGAPFGSALLRLAFVALLPLAPSCGSAAGDDVGSSSATDSSAGAFCAVLRFLPDVAALGSAAAPFLACAWGRYWSQELETQTHLQLHATTVIYEGEAHTLAGMFWCQCGVWHTPRQVRSRARPLSAVSMQVESITVRLLHGGVAALLNPAAAKAAGVCWCHQRSEVHSS
jgi:hypothetical protein